MPAVVGAASSGRLWWGGGGTLVLWELRHECQKNSRLCPTLRAYPSPPPQQLSSGSVIQSLSCLPSSWSLCNNILP